MAETSAVFERSGGNPEFTAGFQTAPKRTSDLEGASASAAETPAGEASTTAEASPAPSRGAGTRPRCGNESRGRLLRHVSDAVYEVDGAEQSRARALVPGGRVLCDPFKVLCPA